jgi:hypothetical protein
LNSSSSAETSGIGLDHLLRATGRFTPGVSRLPWLALIGWTILGGFVYGAVMGSYDFRPRQALYSGLKVPLLLAVITATCLPNFFVLNTLLGLRDDFAAACRGVFAAQAVMAVTLAALAPATAVHYALDLRYSTAVAVNGAAFLLAACGAQFALARHYRPLIAKDPRHRQALAAWLTLYVFVGIQAAWVMRPYVGAPTIETRFFRPSAWSNAYVVVADVVVRQFSGR